MSQKTANRKQKTIIPIIVYVSASLLIVLCSLLFVFFWFFGWNGKDPVNIVVTSGQQIWVLGVRPNEKRLVEISIPDNTIVPVAAGKWQAGSLGRLSGLEKNLNPLKSAGWELLEIPVDSVVEIANYEGENTSYISQLKLLKKLKLVSLLETVKLVRFSKGLNDNQILKVNIGESMAARIVADPAEAELVEIDTEALSTQLSEWFKIESLRREGLAVAIVNVSGKTNAGGKLARQLEHVGIRVVTVSSGEGEPGFRIKSEEVLNSETVRKLSSWLQMKPAVAEFDARADILILR